MLSATELATMLDLSKGRISQLVSEGKLDGCFTGNGRDRRFDPAAVAKVLGKRTDPGQRLGNGAPTQRAISQILGEAPPPPVRPVAPSASPVPPPPALESDYEAARTANAIADLRRKQRLNAEAEGTFVLADEVARQVRRQIAQEIGEVQTYIRDVARRVADRFQIDFKEVRQIMVEDWRTHRGARADAAEDAAALAVMSDAEIAADI